MYRLPVGFMATFLSKEVVHSDHQSIRHRGKNLKAVLRVMGHRRTLKELVNCYVLHIAFSLVKEMGTTWAVVGVALSSTASTIQPHLGF